VRRVVFFVFLSLVLALPKYVSLQIERPMNWNGEKLLGTIRDLINAERCSAVVSRTINKYHLKWNIF